MRPATFVPVRFMALLLTELVHPCNSGTYYFFTSACIVLVMHLFCYRTLTLSLLTYCALLTVRHRHEDADEHRVIMFHQSPWQQRMMELYGGDMCLLDATYNKTWFDLTLYFLSVASNNS